MAGEGPREWSPRGMVWIVFIDSPDGYEVELFKKEMDAYRFAARHARRGENTEKMEDDERERFNWLIEQKKYVLAMEFYDQLVGDIVGSSRKMSFYTINKKMIQ
jgi:hypothetical protein